MDRNNREQILHIDRSKGFSLTDNLNSSGYPLFCSFADNFVLKEQNLRSKTLSEIDISRLEIKVVFDYIRDGQTFAKSEFNELIKKNLIEIENEGYYHLDAPIAHALLHPYPVLVPKEWEEITDPDEHSISSGSIGYYGSTFVLKNGLNDYESVLTPFYSRSGWETAGWNTKYFDPEMLAHIGMDPRVTDSYRQYAAVYKPDTAMSV